MSNRQSGYTAVQTRSPSSSHYVRTSGYNIVTGPNQKVVEAKESRRFRTAIDNCSHLTPVTEAAMENLLDKGSVRVPSRQEVIAWNSPDCESIDCENWDGPSDAQLQEIEAEQDTIDVASD